MARYHTASEIRRYDLLKVGVLALLIVLLLLTWYATREAAQLDATAAAEATAVAAEATAVADGGGAVMPAPTLAVPEVLAPPGPVAPGLITLNGTAGPGAQIVVLAGGQRVGLATAGVDGSWSAQVGLPAGEYVIVAQTLDNLGAVVAESPPLALVVGDGVSGQATTAPGEATAVSGEVTAVPGEATAAPGVGTTVPGEATAAPGEATAAPDEADSVAALLASREDLSSLWAALQAAGLAEPLAGPEQFTLFAPNNGAFAALPDSVLASLQANPQLLSAILQYHVTRGLYTAADLRVVQPSTINGRLLTITSQADGSLSVNEATIIEADVAASNGLIHVIDRLLLPPLVEGVRPPLIDSSGAATFTGTALTIVGTAEPGRTILVELNGEPFGAPARVDVNGNWAVPGAVTPGQYRILAFMLNGETLEAIAPPVDLTVQ